MSSKPYYFSFAAIPDLGGKSVSRVYDQGREAVEAWVKANHPGYPVVIAPEPLSLDAWIRRWSRPQSDGPEA